MTKLPEKNVLDDSKLPKTTIGEMKGALGKIGDYLNELLNVDSTDKETVRMAFKPDITGDVYKRQPELRKAYQIRQKQARSTELRHIYDNVSKTLAAEAQDKGVSAPDSVEVGNIMFDLEAKIVRSQILDGEPRIDGRDTRTVRPITIRTGVLPRTHGSALFTRGETQALVVATLGTSRDNQKIDALMGEYSDAFMMHYNMPPFATGETRCV